MKKLVITALATSVILGGGFYLWTTNSTAPQARAPIDNTPAVVPIMEPITISMVEQHNDVSSCWTVIDNSVYDLTGWVSRHPGGEQGIINLCGRDGTAAFRGQHEGAKLQADMLATFKIGVISS